MAPVTPPSHPNTLTPALLPSLWLIVSATHSTTRTRFTLPLTLLTLCLALHPLLLYHQHWHSPSIPEIEHPSKLHTVFRQGVAPPSTQPLPTGPLAPSPSVTPSPSASPSPIAQQVPDPVQPPISPPPEGFSKENTLDECSGGLKRMQLVLLLELCCEILFLFLRCFADQEEYGERAIFDVTMRGYVFVRAIYVVPVLAINAGIYWIGGGPTGRCLANFSDVQIPFVHLIFYAIYCVIVVIIGVYRIDQYEKNSYYEDDSPTYRSGGPPTRTTSYFRGYGRRGNNSESTSHREPKFRVNLGCCRLNF